MKVQIDHRSEASTALGLFDVDALVRACQGLRERVFARKALAIAEIAAEDMNDFEETMPAARAAATLDGML